MLTAEQKRFYGDNGYLMVENAVTPEQLGELRRIAYEFIDRSRAVSESDDVFDLDSGHSAETPRLTRIKLPHKQHPFFWKVLQDSPMPRVLNDLLGPDTLLQTSKLNTKAPGGGAAVEWHQDWAFYPHTNDDMLAFGLMLEDVDEENGPLMVVPGTHKGPLLSHHHDGRFCGAIDPDDPLFEKDRIVTLTGKAGSMTVHHARTLHGSAPNMSDRNRLILFYECHAADAWPLLGSNSYIHSIGQQRFWADLQERVITGEVCLTPRLEPVPVRMPLPPAKDASSIFTMQKSGGAKSAFA
ncbi:phytanoyl-CoA dioxygenase family protein [Tranquillimonas alkanivorans]|uniref:Ectoine hydroxylase-related dioxygenase, phytanoyl-CoA dioxygenase (PhyH) family n=1 Tax=Tranquillimonas alkanivorans TaxID=441119 RepID=A0A1I5Q9K1_9RHOB|nr:phytanoyl-CoA dioxygenase family protein [Tranquillimonas alkanivorans]SFP42925.1 Ectoine hydroxylase-related dioxygenase, phytanoyl-CoA dioxygenase (PhyH) family [Tranquillimonas alkanivorans]